MGKILQREIEKLNELERRDKQPKFFIENFLEREPQCKVKRNFCACASSIIGLVTEKRNVFENGIV